MAPPLLGLWILVLSVAASTLLLFGSRAMHAHKQATSACHELVSITEQATELAHLRLDRTDFPVRPQGGLASKVSAAMSRAGLESSVLQSLSPEAQTPLTGQDGAKVVRERATLTLTNLSLPQVGKFLDAWRTTEPGWVFSGIELSPIHAPTEVKVALGSDLPLRAVISIEGLFNESTPWPRREPPMGASR